jgi:hypothetical protein
MIDRTDEAWSEGYSHGYKRAIRDVIGLIEETDYFVGVKDFEVIVKKLIGEDDEENCNRS